MFKSTFAKYLTTFVVIIVFSFFMLSFIFTSMIRAYSSHETDNLLIETSYTIKDRIEGNRVQNLDSFIKTEIMARFLLINDAEMNMLVCDTDGRLLFLTTTDPETGKRIPKIMNGSLTISLTSLKKQSSESGDYYLGIGDFDGVLDTENRICARELQYNDKNIGYVLVMKSTAAETALISVTQRAVFTSSLWVMLAAVIAIYFITERLLHPLRSMTEATKSFAKGDFSARVPVYGRDEVSELAVAFNRMAESLANLEKMRNTFLASVSHDLRTPMTTIAGFIDNINSGAIPPEKQGYYLGVVSAEVHRLSRLVSEILDVSRLESGDRKFTFTDFDVSEVARLILISFEQKIEEKKLDVVFESEDCVPVRADKDAIYQVVYNLCHNAIKFAKTEGEFAIRIAPEKGKVRISIFDEGQTISKEDIPYVFDRFYKTDKSRGLDKSGVGLGLYICKTIIDAHGEKLTVTSEEGRGCTFSFTLPAAPSVQKKSGTAAEG